MEIKLAFKELPPDIRLVLGGNIKNCFSSVYINEGRVKLIEHLKQIKHFDFGYYRYQFTSELFCTGEDWNLLSLNLTKISAQKKNKPTKGQFFILEDIKMNLIYIFSPNPKKYIKAVHSFMKDYFYPNISRAFLTSKELSKILDYLEEMSKFPILGRSSSGKILFGKTPETVMRLGKGKKLINYKEHFNKARKDNKWVSWISLETFSEKNKPFRFTLSRECNLGFSFGDFNHFFKILQIISELGLKKCQLLKNKEIKKGEEPKPIILEYELDILNEDSNRKKLISQIENYTGCSYSIIHGGNPHIYIYIIDRLDKSSFSFRTIGFNKIMITPQLKSNYASLLRFINHLVENFSEFKEMKEIEEKTKN